VLFTDSCKATEYAVFEQPTAASVHNTEYKGGILYIR
jgi:hypothetical protein